MWLQDPIDIEVQRNAVTPIGLQIIDCVSNDPINLSGVTLSCSIANAAGEDPVYSPNIALGDPVNGEINIFFDGQAMTSLSPSKQAISFAYDVVITDSEVRYIVMRGTLILSPGVTN